MKRCKMAAVTALAVLASMVAAGPLQAQEDEGAKLAKQLANPVASLISVPLQYNYDENYGPDDKGSKSVLNIQPVWPFALGEDWNLITRTIVPLVAQKDIPPGTDESGLGDILQSFFFSPRKPVNGWILGAGPVILYPTASDDVLGGEKWAVGPTAVALRQTGPWTVGMLVNHIVSIAGNDDRGDINATFLQPFVSYLMKTKTTISASTESTYDWENEKWSVPLNLSVSQLLLLGKLPVSIGATVRYWADSPEYGPEDFGGRLTLTFLFPK